MWERMISFDQLIQDEDPVKLGVVGSRNWPSKDFVVGTISACLRKYPSVTTLVSGGQPKGVDGWAAEYARKHEMPIVEYLPAHYYDSSDERYEPYHPRNYHARNTLIADDSDILLAFCWESSRGTMDTYKKALARNKKVLLLTEVCLRRINMEEQQ